MTLAMDGYLPDYLESLQTSGIFNNTAVFLFGDHGSRYGAMRETQQGRLEERLPLNMIFLPDWWTKSHPLEAKMLYNNQNRLTTPMVIYSTILHIATSPATKSVSPPLPTATYQSSLFTNIPETRTCSEAGIADHWCTCLQWSEMEVTDPVVFRGTSELVAIINGKLQKEGQGCVFPLALNKIRYALKLHSNEKGDDKLVDDKPSMPLKSDHYLVQVQFSTLPQGTGIFEGTFRVDFDQTITAFDSFSRVDTYGTQTCSPKAHMRPFCKCK